MENTDYKEYAHACVHDLMERQKDFNNTYGLSGYENWFYNQGTGLLTFSRENFEVNFRYFTVGSFSKKSNTWKWSWDNETTDENVKKQIYPVKQFGLDNKFSKFDTGCFESDEFEAWEFAAIAAKLSNGLTVYRPVVDDVLQFYLVITAFVDNETAKKIKSKYVECEDHDVRRAAFVCKHLTVKSKLGFNEAFESFEGMELADDDDFQAWCNACEKVRKQEGEWNDTSMAFADIKVVCEKCYFEMKAANIKARKFPLFKK